MRWLTQHLAGNIRLWQLAQSGQEGDGPEPGLHGARIAVSSPDLDGEAAGPAPQTIRGPPSYWRDPSPSPVRRLDSSSQSPADWGDPNDCCSGVTSGGRVRNAWSAGHGSTRRSGAA
jgi:hypothetical protein